MSDATATVNESATATAEKTESNPVQYADRPAYVQELIDNITEYWETFPTYAKRIDPADNVEKVMSDPLPDFESMTDGEIESADAKLRIRATSLTIAPAIAEKKKDRPLNAVLLMMLADQVCGVTMSQARQAAKAAKDSPDHKAAAEHTLECSIDELEQAIHDLVADLPKFQAAIKLACTDRVRNNGSTLIDGLIDALPSMSKNRSERLANARRTLGG